MKTAAKTRLTCSIEQSAVAGENPSRILDSGNALEGRAGRVAELREHADYRSRRSRQCVPTSIAGTSQRRAGSSRRDDAGDDARRSHLRRSCCGLTRGAVCSGRSRARRSRRRCRSRPPASNIRIMNRDTARVRCAAARNRGTARRPIGAPPATCQRRTTRRERLSASARRDAQPISDQHHDDTIAANQPSRDRRLAQQQSDDADTPPSNSASSSSCEDARAAVIAAIS